MAFNLYKYSQATPEQASAGVIGGLEDIEESYSEEPQDVGRDELKKGVDTETQKNILDKVSVKALIDRLNYFLRRPEYKNYASAINAQPAIKRLIDNLDPTLLQQEIEKYDLQGLADQFTNPGSLPIPDHRIKGYLEDIRQAEEEKKNRTQALQLNQQNAFWGAMPGRANSNQVVRIAQVAGPEPVNEEDKGRFIQSFLRDLISYDGQKGNKDVASEQAKNKIMGMVSPALENDTTDALESIQQLDLTVDWDKGARFLGQVFDSFVSKSAWQAWLSSVGTESNLEQPVMSNNTPKGIIKFNLNDHILNNKQAGLEKTASANQSQEYLLYGPTEKRICPKLRGKRSEGGDVVSEYICRHHCLDGIVIDDNKTICGEALWRANAMDKFSREYVDADGKIEGGYLNKRFEINRNVPEETRMRLKPGELRKPRPASMGNLESRMQDMRNKEGEKRGYKPDTNTGQPFEWCHDVDQNNVEVSQQERDRRETSMGHKTVDYTNKSQQENKPKKAFNLKAYKTGQIIPSDGYMDGGAEYTPEEMDDIDHPENIKLYGEIVNQLQRRKSDEQIAQWWVQVAGQTDLQKLQQMLTQAKQSLREMDDMGHEEFHNQTGYTNPANDMSMAFNLKKYKTAEGVNTPLPEDGTPIEPKKKNKKDDTHHSRLVAGKSEEEEEIDYPTSGDPDDVDEHGKPRKLHEEYPSWQNEEGKRRRKMINRILKHQRDNDGQKDKSSGFNLSHYKEAKEKGVTYKGEHFKYNPWAVCNKSTGGKNEAGEDKFERCVQHVKDQDRDKDMEKKKAQSEECPNNLLPDGPVCPRCGKKRAPSGVDGGSWVHFDPETDSKTTLYQNGVRTVLHDNSKKKT